MFDVKIKGYLCVFARQNRVFLPSSKNRIFKNKTQNFAPFNWKNKLFNMSKPCDYIDFDLGMCSPDHEDYVDIKIFIQSCVPGNINAFDQFGELNKCHLV